MDAKLGQYRQDRIIDSDTCKNNRNRDQQTQRKTGTEHLACVMYASAVWFIGLSRGIGLCMYYRGAL